MNRLIYTQLLALLYLLFGSYIIVAQPSLKFLDKRMINLGVIEGDTILRRVVHFINNGNEALEILRIAKSCTCTDAIINKKQFYPSEEGMVKIILNTRNKIGTNEAVVHIVTNTEIEDYIIKIVYIVNRK